MATTYWTEGEARRALEELAASGLSVAEYSRRSGIQEKRVRYWRQRLAVVPAATLDVVPVRIRGSSRKRSGSRAAAAPPLEVVVGARVVRVPAGFDPATLAEVIATLERSC